MDRIGKNGLTEYETPISLDAGERVRAYANVDNRVYPLLPLLAGLFIKIISKPFVIVWKMRYKCNFDYF